MSIEAMKMGLEALEIWAKLIEHQYSGSKDAMNALQWADNDGQKVIAALKAAIEEAEKQEAVARADAITGREAFNSFVRRRFLCEFEALGMVFPCDLDLAWQAACIWQREQAIEEAEKQEAVAWHDKHGMITHDPFDGVTPLYTAPPAREWVGLTDEEIKFLWGNMYAEMPFTFHAITGYIEAKLKEKNYGRN